MVYHSESRAYSTYVSDISTTNLQGFSVPIWDMKNNSLIGLCTTPVTLTRLSKELRAELELHPERLKLMKRIEEASDKCQRATSGIVKGVPTSQMRFWSASFAIFSHSTLIEPCSIFNLIIFVCTTIFLVAQICLRYCPLVPNHFIYVASNIHLASLSRYSCS